jgi:Ca2+/Na+ antiporter
LNNRRNGFPLAPIGCVLGGAFFIIAMVAIIVPCARRRQKRRLKWLTEDGNSANVLCKDVEASGLLKGSLEEIFGGQVQSDIF